MNEEDTTTKRKNMLSKLSFKIDLLKASRTERHSYYYDLAKNGAAPRTVHAIRCNHFFALLNENIVPKGAFWEIQKIENGTNIDQSR